MGMCVIYVLYIYEYICIRTERRLWAGAFMAVCMAIALDASLSPWKRRPPSHILLVLTLGQIVDKKRKSTDSQFTDELNSGKPECNASVLYGAIMACATTPLSVRATCVPHIGQGHGQTRWAAGGLGGEGRGVPSESGSCG